MLRPEENCSVAGGTMPDRLAIGIASRQMTSSIQAVAIACTAAGRPDRFNQGLSLSLQADHLDACLSPGKTTVQLRRP